MSSSRPASPPSRLAVSVVLLAALALSACGRAAPDITAEDGRDLESPSGGIWVPEVRRVEDEPGAQEVDADEAEVRSAATSASEDPDPAGAHDGGGGSGEGAGSRRPAEDAGAAGDPGARERDEVERDRAGDDEHGADDVRDAGDQEPSAPEVVGDCGVPARGAGPDDDELAAAVDALRERLEDDWADTHAGAWLVEDGERTLVHVGFIDGVRAALEVLCDEFAHRELLVGVRTELSDAELRDLADEVVAERDALRAGEPAEDLPAVIRRTEGRYAVAVDAAANGLRLTVEAPTERLRDAFRDRYTPRLALVAGTVDDDGEVVEDGPDEGEQPDAERERSGAG